ncbi:MAG: molybdopterin-guanine dinucleotide biosynthesis protein B [Cloacibacillus sp.]
MRIFAVSGFSKTGKTTVTEALIRSISGRGLLVATIKDSGCKDIAMENTGSDTGRQRAAGASAAVLRTPEVTSFVYGRQLTLCEILPCLNFDVVILEGFKKLDIPKIVTASSIEEAASLCTSQTFALSGKAAECLGHLEDIPLLNCFTEADKLTELALRRAWEDVGLVLEKAEGSY